MKPEIFADTNYWVALFNPKDSLFARSVYYSESTPSTEPIVTSQVILGEVIEQFAKKSIFIKEHILRFIAELDRDSRIIIEPMTPKLFEDTIAFYRRHLDKEWGFVDCSSFVIMKRRGIKDALTYDRHFIQAGFKALLRE
jgi:predicted nucleic acid-binding protein